MTMTPSQAKWPVDDDNNNRDDTSTWGMDSNDDALTDTFPSHPFSFTSNTNVDTLTHQQITDLGTGSHRLTINYSILQQ